MAGEWNQRHQRRPISPAPPATTLSFHHSALTNQGDYSVIISNQYGAVTSLVANLAVSAVAVLPSITNNGARVTNFIGNNHVFTVNPKGTPEFQYKWYFGGAALADGLKYSGAASSSLIVSNLQLSDAGTYYVAITNAAGGISNLVSVLVVQYVAPTIPVDAQPTSITMLQGQTNSLRVSSAAGTAPLAFQWRKGTPASSVPLSDVNEFSAQPPTR